jgi:hypothetical protein
MRKRWAIKLGMTQRNIDSFVWKDYDLLEAKDIVKKLKQETKDKGLSPVTTWMLEHGFNLFDETYKAQGYTLISLSITDIGKNDEAVY